MKFSVSTILILMLAGCGGGDGVQRAAVQGKITFDGAPVESGTVQFIPQAGVKGPPVEFIIKDGAYSTASGNGPTVGNNRVEVFAHRKTGKKIKDIMGVEGEESLQYIPAKYNTDSTLTAEIKAGANEYSFELKGK